MLLAICTISEKNDNIGIRVIQSLFGRILMGAIALIALAVTVIRLVRTPSSDRQWHAHQSLPPDVKVRGDLVEIRNIRDFVHRSATDFDVHYLDRAYDLRKLDAADYVVSRFGSVPGLAHAFLTFRFGDEYVSISVEARKERTESYSPLRGVLNEYELMYVIGSERDLIGLRTHVWKEEVILYPIRTTPDNLRRLFIDMIERANEVSQDPEFYNTLTNSCSSNIVRHVNRIAPGHIGFDLRTVLPGFSDRTAYELGLIDTSQPLERVRERFRIDRAAAGVPLDENFSQAIRRHLPAAEPIR
jgi:hypothetical protein